MNLLENFTYMEIMLIILCSYLINRLYRMNKLAREMYIKLEGTERYLKMTLPAMILVEGLMEYNVKMFGQPLPPGLPDNVNQELSDAKFMLTNLSKKDEHE